MSVRIRRNRLENLLNQAPFLPSDSVSRRKALKRTIAAHLGK